MTFIWNRHSGGSWTNSLKFMSSNEFDLDQTLIEDPLSRHVQVVARLWSRADLLEDPGRTLTMSSCHLKNLIRIKPQWKTHSHNTFKFTHDFYLKQSLLRILDTLPTSSCHLPKLIWIRPKLMIPSHSTCKLSNYFDLEQTFFRILDELSQLVHVIYRIWFGSDLNGGHTLTARASCRMTLIWSRPSWGSAWGSPSPCIQRIRDTCPLAASPHRWQTSWRIPSSVRSFPWKTVSVGSVREFRPVARPRGGWCQPMSRWTCCPLLWREIARLQMKIKPYE